MRRAGILALPLLLAGCVNPAATIAEGSYRNAVAVRAERVLADHGVHLTGRLTCRTSGPADWSAVTVACAGTDTGGKAVRVAGTVAGADTTHPTGSYTITVDAVVLAVTGL